MDRGSFIKIASLGGLAAITGVKPPEKQEPILGVSGFLHRDLERDMPYITPNISHPNPEYVRYTTVKSFIKAASYVFGEHMFDPYPFDGLRKSCTELCEMWNGGNTGFKFNFYLNTSIPDVTFFMDEGGHTSRINLSWKNFNIK